MSQNKQHAKTGSMTDTILSANDSILPHGACSKPGEQSDLP